MERIEERMTAVGKSHFTKLFGWATQYDEGVGEPRTLYKSVTSHVNKHHLKLREKAWVD